MYPLTPNQAAAVRAIQKLRVMHRDVYIRDLPPATRRGLWRKGAIEQDKAGFWHVTAYAVKLLERVS